ncbi:MAG: ABC-2 transporter permease [Oscillospiraceae bacterium]|nr:ABC-2 transporter permease [Oscillospiraceae bacterium]
MKGLVLKDLLALKSIIKTIILIIGIFMFSGIVSGNTFLVTYAAVYAAIMPLNLMAYDESCRFNRFAQILPITNTQIVLARYISGFVICIAAAAVSIVALAISGNNWAEGAMAGIAVPLVYQVFTVPVMYKWGVEKSRYITMAAFLIPFVVIMTLSDGEIIQNAVTALQNISPLYFAAATAAVIAVMYVCSIYLSVKIVKNKEW